jgi:general L-amino acid transport system permease protein
MSDQPSDAMTPGKPAPWNDPKIRAIVFQALLVGAVVMFGFYLINNTLYNMEQRGISTGFSFLEKESGFGVTRFRHGRRAAVEELAGRTGRDRLHRDLP